MSINKILNKIGLNDLEMNSDVRDILELEGS
jgi:hypothetical protein